MCCLGLLGVAFICGLTAYNDYVVANTFLVGNFLPIGLLLFFLAFILLINGPLHKFMPRLAFSTGRTGRGAVHDAGELRLALQRHDALSARPLIAPWYHAGTNSDYAKVHERGRASRLAFPNFEREGEARSNDPVVKYYWDRMPLEDTPSVPASAAVPWAAWVRPTVAWGLLASMVVGGILCLSVIFRRQWVENERLPYPLANVYLSLIEEPVPGTMLNTPVQQPLVLDCGRARVRDPWLQRHEHVPARASGRRSPSTMPSGAFSASRHSSTPTGASKSATLYFCMVGITYFLQSQCGPEPLALLHLFQVTKMFFGTYQADFTAGMQQDQNLGSVLMFAATVLFVGRQQLVLVARQMFSRPAADEAQGRYLPYFLAGWGLVLCAGGIVAG